jgi:transposase InsO family protein
MNGIKRQLIAAYTPQQNGVAERKNHTVVEMARSMLQTKGLSNSFWGDAVHLYIFSIDVPQVHLI